MNLINWKESIINYKDFAAWPFMKKIKKFNTRLKNYLLNQ